MTSRLSSFTKGVVAYCGSGGAGDVRLLTLLSATLLLLGCGYVPTHAAYERLVAASPPDRATVSELLPGFKETEITDPERMETLVRERMESGEKYMTYTRYPGYSIVVVYDEADKVIRLWPAYE